LKNFCVTKNKKNTRSFPWSTHFSWVPKKKSKEEIPGFDFTILGAPWEGVCTWGSFTGCELATKSLRQASIRYGAFLPEIGFDIFDYIKGADYGDTYKPWKYPKNLREHS
jgi:agmatinase